MNNEQLKADWLNWFKLAVTQAKDARLQGKIQDALRLDGIVERYYLEAEDCYDFGEDLLVGIESNIRGGV